MIEAILGPLVGILGSVATNWLKLKERKLDIERARIQGEIDLRIMEAEHKYTVERVKVQADAATQASADRAFADSYSHDRAAYGGGVVDTIRGMVRPVLTAYLLVLATWLTWVSWDLIGGPRVGLSVADALDIFRSTVRHILALSAMAVGWWFGDRQINKRLGR